MKKLTKVLQSILLSAGLFYCCKLPVFAITEAEVQATVDAVGKEAVTGNLFIWFLCAVAFLKVSQKIDSFLSSLGVHVGNTGGSMLAEAMVAAKGFGTMMSVGGSHFGKAGGVYHTGSKFGGFSGGLAGIITRQLTSSAIKSVTTCSGNSPNGSLGGKLYSSSVGKGGSFANNVISTIANGSIREQGSITGDNASDALMSYLGYNALEDGAANIPVFSNVEIGGGRITGTEFTEAHPEGMAFGMYSTEQYSAPSGSYETVHTVDGSAWYKQYAVDSVEKSPYEAPDGSVAYHESIVKKLPNPPARKDRL